MAKKYTIDSKVLRAIKNDYFKEVSEISPLLYGEDRKLTFSEKKKLKEEEVISTQNEMNDEAKEIFSVLANAKKYSRVRYSSSIDLFEYILYDDMNEKVSFVNSEGSFIVEKYEGSEDLLKGISQNSGNSFLKSFDFDEKLTLAQSLILFSFIDLQRKKLLAGFVNDVDFDDIGYEKKDVIKGLSSEDSRCFTSYITNDELVKDCKENYVKHANELIKKGLLSKKGNILGLSNTAGLIAGRFLMIDSVYAIATGKINEASELINAGFMCIQSGVNDILYIENSEVEMRLSTITSFEMLEYFKFILETEEELEDFYEEEVIAKEEISKPISKPKAVCSNCNEPIEEGVNFCPKCGNDLRKKKPTSAPKAKFCNKCGEKYVEGAAFCRKCGNKLS